MGETLKGVREGIRRHQLSLVAAGVAYYAMLAIFPAMIALVAVYGLVTDPHTIEDQLAPITKAMPAGAGDLVKNQLTAVAHSNHGGLTVGLVIGLLATLWAAAGAVRALSTGLSIIYGQAGRKAFVERAVVSLVLTLGALVTIVIAIALVAAFPVALNHLGLGSAANLGAQVARGVALIVLIGLGLAVLYHFGPIGERPPWRWVSWGTVTTMVLWIVGSAGFSIYVANFGSYNETYGSIAAVIVLMLWLYLSAFAVLLGAEVDAVRSHRGGTGLGTEAADMASSEGG